MTIYTDCIDETEKHVNLVGREACKELICQADRINKQYCLMSRDTDFGDTISGFINIDNVITLKKALSTIVR